MCVCHMWLALVPTVCPFLCPAFTYSCPILCPAFMYSCLISCLSLVSGLHSQWAFSQPPAPPAPPSPVLPLSVLTCMATQTPATRLVNQSLHFHFSRTSTFSEACTRFHTELQAPPLSSQAFSLTAVQYFADWFHTEY